ncbi:hypothetical protein BGZ93_004182 [Podila epicladia]|nr:hypothetical protein BGZ93_004182 [Podila epicladia]
MLKYKGKNYEVEMSLSDQVVTEGPWPLLPTTGDIMMKKLYHDTVHHDVFFTFHHDESTAERTLEGQPGIFHKSVVISAHKHVLRQWPYFQRMFDSEFVEGGSGEKKIQIKSETSWAAVFMAVHRYDLLELCQAAQRHIEAKIKPQ